MANEKFEPGEIITDTEVRLECLRLATEFGPENDRRDPLPIAENYFDWLLLVMERISLFWLHPVRKVHSQ